MGNEYDLTDKKPVEVDTVTGATGSDHIIIIRNGVPKKVLVSNTNLT